MKLSSVLMAIAAALAASGCCGPAPATHVLLEHDRIGIDPISGELAADKDGKRLTESDAVDLTLLHIVKEEKLVSRLGVFDLFLPEESRAKLSRWQRNFPERGVASWPDERKEVYYRAAAIVIAAIKRRNPPLGLGDLVPGREIALPAEI